MALFGLFVFVVIASFVGGVLALKFTVWRQMQKMKPHGRSFWSRVYDR
jgi:UPF0716 family protein affecting phage T7 exclusion